MATETSGPIRCTVVSPERALFEGSAEKVVVPGAMGQFGVLPRHAPLIAKLEPGVIRIHRPPGEGGSVTRMAVGGGFAQVLGNAVTLLVTEAVVSEDVDPETVRRELAGVIERLAHPKSDEDYRDLLRLRRSLQARLSLVE